MAESRSEVAPGDSAVGAPAAYEVPLSSTVIPLRQSAVERSLKQASFDTAGMPLLAVNHSGQILAINSEAMALVGGESVVGRSVAELLGFLSHRAFA
ncbi:MAG TPA: PAS domain-containing protein, partial [Burkholderiaceae bacterium]|nr:PAS domain-containing protein [Burkholderiaceae bacterium]